MCNHLSTSFSIDGPAALRQLRLCWIPIEIRNSFWLQTPTIATATRFFFQAGLIFGMDSLPASIRELPFKIEIKITILIMFLKFTA